MGMATIKKHLGEGLYSCTYRYDTARKDEQIKQLTALLVQLALAIAEKGTAISTQESAIGQIEDLLDIAISAGDVSASRTQVAALSQATVTLQALKIDLERLKAEQAAAQIEKQVLENLQTEFDFDLWVADFSLELQTDNLRPAPTAEIPGETFEMILLPANGEENTPTYDLAAHALMVPFEVLSGVEIYYNAAVLAGWQKYAPGYRIGRIETLNPDGTVALTLIGPNTSSQQSLSVRPTSPHDDEEPTYSEVPVQYLDCDAAAFLVGDEVLIEYQEHDALQPRVIGFRDHPRPCGSNIVTELGLYNKEAAFSSAPGLLYGDRWWTGTAAAISWDENEMSIFQGGKRIEENIPGDFILGAGLQKTDAGFRLNIVTTVGANPFPQFPQLPIKYLVHKFYTKLVGVGGWQEVGEIVDENTISTANGAALFFGGVVTRPITWYRYEFNLTGDVTIGYILAADINFQNTAIRQVTATYSANGSASISLVDTPLVTGGTNVGGELPFHAGWSPNGTALIIRFLSGETSPGSGIIERFLVWPDGQRFLTARVGGGLGPGQGFNAVIFSIDGKNQAVFAIDQNLEGEGDPPPQTATPRLIVGDTAVWTGSTTLLPGPDSTNPFQGMGIRVSGLHLNGLIGVSGSFGGVYFGRLINSTDLSVNVALDSASGKMGVL